MTVNDIIDIEKAPSGYSRCRICRQKIQQGELRLAICLDWHGCSPRYICLDCLKELNRKMQMMIQERRVDIERKLGG